MHQRSSRIDLGVLCTNARWALARTWAIHAPLTMGLVGVTLVRSVLPAGLALLGRGVINTVAALIQDGSATLMPLVPWLVGSAVLTFVDAISRALQTLLSARLGDELNLHITSDVLTHAANVDFCCFEDPHFHDILEQARHNPSTHFASFIQYTLTLVTSGLQLVSLAGILIVIEPYMAPLLLPIVPLYFLHQWRLARHRYGRERARATKRRLAGYFSSQLTSYHSIAEIKLLDLVPVLCQRFRSLMTDFRDEERQFHRHDFIGTTIFGLLTASAFYVVFARVTWQAIGGNLTLGDVALYAGSVMVLRTSLHTAILALSKALEQTLYIAHLRQFLALRPRQAAAAGLTPALRHGTIEVHNVSFTYPGATQPALHDISFTVRAGETVALVGENGSGKTTLVKLLARLYDPHAGRILFDGFDLQDITLEHLRRHLAVVPQYFGRYEATVAENIAYGDWQRLLDDPAAIRRVALRADVHDLIESMPQGYDTRLGYLFGTHNLSEGQWQRLAAARAFARDAALLILDEPTAHLDARNEYRLFVRFRELAKHTTTILISHRFSTVSMADRILVLHQGRLVESGTHDALLKQAGYYATLYDLHRRQVAAPLTE